MPLSVLVPMKTSFPSAKALKLFTWLTVSASKLNLSQIIISPEGEGVYCFTSVRPSFHPSKIFFVAFFSATINGINLIFGHKLHIGMPYCGKRFWTHQIPTSCLPTWLVFIHIEHISTFFVTFFLATIDGRNLIFGHKLHVGTPYRGKRFWTHQIPTSCLPT